MEIGKAPPSNTEMHVTLHLALFLMRAYQDQFYNHLPYWSEISGCLTGLPLLDVAHGMYSASGKCRGSPSCE